MDHAFQFLDADLQQQFIEELEKRAIVHRVGHAGEVRFGQDVQQTIENELMCEIRDRVFASWQIVTCPEADVAAYRAFMSKHDIRFQEEISDGERWFLIPRKHRPHSWKIASSAAAKLIRS